MNQRVTISSLAAPFAYEGVLDMSLNDGTLAAEPTFWWSVGDQFIVECLQPGDRIAIKIEMLSIYDRGLAERTFQPILYLHEDAASPGWYEDFGDWSGWDTPGQSATWVGKAGAPSQPRCYIDLSWEVTSYPAATYRITVTLLPAAKTVYEDPSRADPGEAWFSFAGSKDDALYIFASTGLSSSAPVPYAMLKSTDGGETWAAQDAANAPVRASGDAGQYAGYHALSAVQVGDKIYVTVCRPGGQDERGWDSDYYAIAVFDCLTDEWRPAVNGPHRINSSYFAGSYVYDQWNPRVSLATSGSGVRMTYTYFEFEWSFSHQILARYADFANGSWSGLDSVITPRPGDSANKAAGVAYAGGAYRHFELSWLGFVDSWDQPPMHLVLDGQDVTPNLLPLENSFVWHSLSGKPLAYSDGGAERLAVPYYAYPGSALSVAIGPASGISWTLEEVDAATGDPPSNSYECAALAYAAAGQKIHVAFDGEQEGSEGGQQVKYLRYGSLTAAAAGLHVFYVGSSGDVMWSRRDAGGWTIPAVFQPGALAHDVSVMVTSGAGPAEPPSGARYYAFVN